MNAPILDALALRDLTDAAAGPHAMQLLVREVIAAVRARWNVPVVVWRAPPVTTAEENYDALGYPKDGAAREAKHTRWLDEAHLLRTQTSAMVPAALQALRAAEPVDVLLACPGLVWRRDRVDRLHVGAPHQLDLWRISNRPLRDMELAEMIATVAQAALPGRSWRSTPTSHPYTERGLELEVLEGGAWIEVGECGLAAPEVLARAGLPHHHGLAMGLGLDRLLMLRKGIDDVRLLRSDDPRAVAQLEDLAPWKPWSNQPAVRRDLFDRQPGWRHFRGIG
jgi:phenylalanyl-tRNA synthetase alpha chain